MQRNALRTYAAALAAVCAAAGNVECTDDVEHSLLKGVHVRLLCAVKLRAVEDALAAAARRTHIAAGVAADAAAELILEESELFFRAHGFDLLDLCKAVCVLCVAALADGLVENLVLLALADMAALQHAILIGERLFAVERLHGDVLVCIIDRDVRDALNALLLDLLEAELAHAADTDNVSLITVYAVLCYELVEAVRIAGLQEDKRLALKLRALDHIFTEVRAAEAVVDEVCVQILRRLKVRRLRVIGHIATTPAEHTVYGAIAEQLFCAVDHFLHLKSSSLTFLPSEVIFATNSFMVWENFTPSAAETHSTRVRPCSTPM